MSCKRFAAVPPSSALPMKIVCPSGGYGDLPRLIDKTKEIVEQTLSDTREARRPRSLGILYCGSAVGYTFDIHYLDTRQALKPLVNYLDSIGPYLQVVAGFSILERGVQQIDLQLATKFHLLPTPAGFAYNSGILISGDGISTAPKRLNPYLDRAAMLTQWTTEQAESQSKIWDARGEYYEFNDLPFAEQRMTCGWTIELRVCSDIAGKTVPGPDHITFVSAHGLSVNGVARIGSALSPARRAVVINDGLINGYPEGISDCLPPNVWASPISAYNALHSSRFVNHTGIMVE